MTETVEVKAELVITFNAKDPTQIKSVTARINVLEATADGPFASVGEAVDICLQKIAAGVIAGLIG